MNSAPAVRPPASVEPAIQRVKAAARAACERTIESLALAALSSNNVFQRDGLLAAQFELNRKSAVFALTFNEALDDRLVREIRPRGAAAAAAANTNWDTLSLVDDRELEVQVAAERFGLEIGHHCEWELRELDGYIGALFALAGQMRTEHDRNPLRPETIGYAVIRAIESVADRSDIRKVLEAEFARSLAATMATTYSGVIAELRAAGLKPAGMSVRNTERGAQDFRRSGPGALAQPPQTGDGSDAGPSAGPRPSGPGGFAHSQRGDMQRRREGPGTPMGRVDAELMALMRRLTSARRAAGAESGAGSGEPSRPGEFTGYDSGATPFEEFTEDGLRLAAPNLIRAHREELRLASNGAFDHMVIDVVGSLFDQILSDPKVPPQMARQIGRLQLPVLRTALGDPTFFSSRKHPVRRFINRMASLASAIEDFDDDDGRRFMGLVRELVQEIVEGDFDQFEVYEHKLGVLESFVGEQARREVHDRGDTAELLAAKEGELRVRQRYAQQLDGELQSLSVPEFVRDFLSQVWSQVLLTAAHQGDSDGTRMRRLRHAGRELFMSVQPKGSPAQRKAFLIQLPKLMQELNEGMGLIGWPDSAKKTFFNLLLPAHAQSLKGEGLRTLDFNLLARQVDGVFDSPLPTVAELPPTADLPVLTDEAILPSFSAAELQRIGLVSEATFDWNGKVDIDLGAEAPLADSDIAIEGMPAPEPSEAAEPMQGKSLADHVQIGFAYQMHLDGEWQKVRLNHVSPSRSFFVFTRGKKHKQTISLTHRMLVRLCDSGRLRAFESAYLLERATARVRRQLGAVKPALATTVA